MDPEGQDHDLARGPSVSVTAAEHEGSGDEGVEKPRTLPPDLPTSLDDRRSFPSYNSETEIYDGWQGQSQFLTTPMPTKPLSFNVALDDINSEEDFYNPRLPSQSLTGGSRLRDRPSESNDARLMEMLAAQAAHRDGDNVEADEDDIASDEKLSEQEKKEILQRTLNMAASNGDVTRVKKLVTGKAMKYIDINAPDEEGTAPLIYASCFGHHEVVSALLDAGAFVDQQDRNQWSALMWAMTNRHKTIAKNLLDHGASPDIRSSSGGTAFDFIQPGTDISKYLYENGYNVGSTVGGADFYDSGFAHNRFEEEMAENEMKRRMMMEESAINLEVDLSSLGLNEKHDDSPDEYEEQPEFVWDRCLNDQMFVFQENELVRILDIVITNMTPQRSPSQKPVPANLLFLCARYAHYHASPDLLQTLLHSATDRINRVVEKHQWDMTILAFWISNATLLLHYLKKDAGLVEATVEFQLHLAELINEIFILIIRDAERRIDKILDTAMLDHETIPGFEDVQFQNEWKLFRTKSKVKPEPMEKRYRPPSPKRRAEIAPRNVTSLLSSTLFVLDLYDVHSIITTQIISQLFYWLGSELFNRIMTTKHYLARTKAMQIRMNVSALEDWARTNNRQPEHYENGSATCTGENTVESARRHLEPLIELLQWLQCFSSLGEDMDSLIETLEQLQRLTPNQLLHAVKLYRSEVGEKGLSKSAMKLLISLQNDPSQLRQILDQHRQHSKPTGSPAADQGKDETKPTEEPQTPRTPRTSQPPSSPSGSTSPAPPPSSQITIPKNAPLLLDPSLTLPFQLPTSTDMLVSYGAGFGGVNRERARKYIPTVPTEFLVKFDRE
ncbi:DIL and Ankyrin domain-containing protein [Trichophyton equinum CBS 127.97]|uniref:DIL and Ankyrin domain-containing protein n=1 Tax=Trichophyton equinum (strain ATCC MYA-4606 / CBS 127.97) TaxID=559882 RepID=F2PP68_TRIEC|nr:DIL and Ankyrin domain-containing protein [Trichophyton equinum CBS 127.97]